MSYRRGPKLKDQLVRADVGPSSTPKQTTISGSQNPGTFPCRGCAQCNNVQKDPDFTHPLSGHKYKVPGHFSCNSNFVVYLIKCPCGLGYVGETPQRVKECISQQKSTIQNKRIELPIPDHFISNNHDLSQLKYQIIDWVPPQ